jgi:hypothetical protein
MSGPKKSHYEIRQEIYQQRQAQKMAKRQVQVSEILHALTQIDQRLLQLSREYKEFADNIVTVVKNWQRDINTDGDLRDSWRSIKGMDKYLDNQQIKLQERKNKFDAHAKIQEQQIFAEEKITQEKAIHHAKITSKIELLEAIEHDYSEIFNEGIAQRITLFKQAIASNPDNTNTLKQIEDFKAVIVKQFDEYQNKKEDTAYIAETFANALGANIQNGSDGNYSISGSIDGVPISVNLNNKNNSIEFNTPTDGSCKKGLDAIQKKLASANINLGEIKVLRTGQTLNAAQYNEQIKVKA